MIAKNINMYTLKKDISMRIRSFLFLFSLASLLFSAYYTPLLARRRKSSSMRTQIKEQQKEQTLLPTKYPIKQFNFADIAGLSNSQLDQHQKLYADYINKHNQIDEKLKFIDRHEANTIYSPFRSLKVSQTYARNGVLLHELYFENLSTGKKIQPNTEQLLTKNFGSISAFKKDLMDCANCARGWVVTSFCIDDRSVKNFVLDTNNKGVPLLTIPILVIDVYEHAYMIDFGINRAAYIKTIWDSINWDIIEKRIVKWVKPHENMSA